MKKISALVIIFSLAGINCLFSQENHLSIQYDMSFSTGDMGDYISSPSFRGTSMQYRYAVSDRFLVGIDVAWNVFYEKKDYDSYTRGTQTLSGIQYRYQSEVPLLAAVDYVLSPDTKLTPYLGLGVGTMYSERTLDMGMYRWEENPWHFALKPEVGLLYDFSQGTSAKVAAKYYYGLEAGDLASQGYFSVSIGLAFRF